MTLHTNTDISEKIKYQLVHRLFLFYFFGIASSVVFLFFSKEILLGPNLMAVSLLSLCIGLLQQTKNYRLVSVICTSATFLILSYTFLAIRASQFLSPLWMVLNIVFSFLIVGRIWGIFVLTAHFIVYLYFTVHVNVNNIVLPSHFSESDTVSFIIQLFVVSSSLAYILIQYLKAMRLNEESLKNVNTELFNKNKVISKQKDEMEVMLREIHHRVKNNLQIISSLLRLQSENDKKEGLCSFKEAITRINAMAIIHEKMYQSESLSQFDIERYIQSLVESILKSHANDRPKLNLSIQLDNFHQKTIIPLALLLNELIINSLKHAFSSQNNPEISIEMRPIENSTKKFRFIYADNGHWKEDAHPKFGSDIIQSMTNQLDGSFVIDKSQLGTRYTFELVQSGFE